MQSVLTSYICFDVIYNMVVRSLEQFRGLRDSPVKAVPIHALDGCSGSNNVVAGILRGEARTPNNQDVVARTHKIASNGEHVWGRNGACHGGVLEGDWRRWIPGSQVSVSHSSVTTQTR